MNNNNQQKLAKLLVLDELFDLTLYRRLYMVADQNVRPILGMLIPIEEKHLAHWQNFFNLKINELDFVRRIKLAILVFICRIFGVTAIHLILEAIEVYGVRKYLSLWEAHQGTSLGEATKAILIDEFEHEDKIVAKIAERKINPERIRNIFLGFNDGSVELLGAVSGFFAAFQDAASVLIAGFTVAVAGAISMAAGGFASSSSAEEIARTEHEKKDFLAGTRAKHEIREMPFRSAVIVGISYFIGAMTPIFPVLLGAKNVWSSIVVSGIAIILVSFVLSFLSGMRIMRRVLMNLLIIAAAVGISYSIGLLAKNWWGISI